MKLQNEHLNQETEMSESISDILNTNLIEVDEEHFNDFYSFLVNGTPPINTQLGDRLEELLVAKMKSKVSEKSRERTADRLCGFLHGMFGLGHQRRSVLIWTISGFLLIIILLAAVPSVRATARDAIIRLTARLGENAVVSVVNGGLRVFDDGSTITEDGGQVEVLPYNSRSESQNHTQNGGMQVENEPGEVTITKKGTFGDNLVPPTSPQSVVTRIITGTVIVQSDGSMLTEAGGRIELLPNPPPQVSNGTPEEASIDVEIIPSDTVPDSSPLPVTCYAATSDGTSGDTTYQRIVEYCVNDKKNEVVMTITFANTGDRDTEILASVGLGICGTRENDWEIVGPWQLAPGAVLRFEPLRELTHSGDLSSKIIEKWTENAVYSCFPN